jgi:hypothetical protein
VCCSFFFWLALDLDFLFSPVENGHGWSQLILCLRMFPRQPYLPLPVRFCRCVSWAIFDSLLISWSAATGLRSQTRRVLPLWFSFDSCSLIGVLLSIFSRMSWFHPPASSTYGLLTFWLFPSSALCFSRSKLAFAAADSDSLACLVHLSTRWGLPWPKSSASLIPGAREQSLRAWFPPCRFPFCFLS